MLRKPFKNSISAGELIGALLNLSERTQICLLDSCGAVYLDSRYFFAGISPLRTFEITNRNAAETLLFLDEQFAKPNLFHIFTLSYDFGLKLENIESRQKKFSFFEEPDVFLAEFDVLIVFDYVENQAFLIGNEQKFDEIENEIFRHKNKTNNFNSISEISETKITSNFTKAEYLENVEKIQEFIRRGETYQTNLTQQFHAQIAPELSTQTIFSNLRKNHPAAFSAFIQRKNSTAISASPERFFKTQNLQSLFFDPNSKIQKSANEDHISFIETSPVKGTSRRGADVFEDLNLRDELLNSEKNRAENIMIVDLLRNDLGRICEYGKISVEQLCEIETHPTFFHLVSTVRGELKKDIKFSDILKAVFPCGSITGAPKISTMRIIDRLETASRGLSMGAIGLSIPNSGVLIQDANFKNSESQISNAKSFDLSVAIRTMTVFGDEAFFNVGGGIVIDSDGEQEYEETLIKAKALFNALNAKF